MPYIKEKEKDRLDRWIDNLAAELNEIGITGNLNYVLFRLANVLCHNYATYSAFIADLECNKLEVYRRMLAPYEDKAIERNGDAK